MKLLVFVAFLAAFYWLNAAVGTAAKTNNHLQNNFNIVSTTFFRLLKSYFYRNVKNQNYSLKVDKLTDSLLVIIRSKTLGAFNSYAH